MFIHVIAVQFHKLFQDSSMASSALDCILDRVVEMTVDILVVFIIRVVRPKDVATRRTTKVFEMEFLAHRRDIRPFQRIATMIAYQVQSSEVISFTQRLLGPIRALDREEHGGHRFMAILCRQRKRPSILFMLSLCFLCLPNS